MLAVLSPAKSLDYETPLPVNDSSEPQYLDRANALIESLKTLSPEDIGGLMHISEALAELNFTRYQEWQSRPGDEHSRAAIYAFKGDVYIGLAAYEMSAADIEFANERLRFLSGLYGVLRPLDRIQPYRLEMGTRFANERGNDLYDYWGHDISIALNQQLAATDSDTLINLASHEYFKSVDTDALAADVITPVFKDLKKGGYKIVSFFAKKARGRMSAFLVKNRLSQPEDLKAFDWDGYRFDAKTSTATTWMFLRDAPPS